MTSILTEAITGPSAWVAADFDNDNSWINFLSEQDIAGIDAAVAKATTNDVAYPKLRKEDIDFGFLEPKLKGFREDLENGRGFFLLRGLPIERYSEEEINLIYYGLGLHMGSPVGQNPQGDLLGKVMAVADPTKKDTRVYQTNLYLPYHTDPSDVVGLMCVRRAKRGGMSSLVSVASIYNRILAEHRELLGLYYKQYWDAHLGNGSPMMTSIFSYNGGKISCRYLRKYYELGHEKMDLPLSTVEVEAFDVFDRIMHEPEMRMDMMLEPGDIQFANNHAALHSRNDFDDHEAPEKMRKMLRLWLKMDGARTPGPEFPTRNGFEILTDAMAS